MLRFVAVLSMLCTLPALAADPVATAKARWAVSPYGPMLERILPPGFEAHMLPEPGSRGAQLALRYCVQCHNLPNPAMHHAAKWPSVFDRMVVRMQGRGNMGKLMAEMMAGVAAPDPQEARELLAYLRKYAQKPLDPAKVPEVDSAAAEPFRVACQQCHVLPDPQRHTAKEWPAIVARMQGNMEWMNRVVGSKPVPGEPQLRVDAINAFLARFAKSPTIKRETSR